MADDIDAVRPWFVDALRAADPDVGEPLAETFAATMGEGALPPRFKSLLAMAIDAALGEGHGVEVNAARARARGATERELLEAVAVVTVMCGLAGLATCTNAFEDWESPRPGSD